MAARRTMSFATSLKCVWDFLFERFWERYRKRFSDFADDDSIYRGTSVHLDSESRDEKSAGKEDRKEKDRREEYEEDEIETECYEILRSIDRTIRDFNRNQGIQERRREEGGDRHGDEIEMTYYERVSWVSRKIKEFEREEERIYRRKRRRLAKTKEREMIPLRPEERVVNIWGEALILMKYNPISYDGKK